MGKVLLSIAVLILMVRSLFIMLQCVNLIRIQVTDACGRSHDMKDVQMFLYVFHDFIISSGQLDVF